MAEKFVTTKKSNRNLKIDFLRGNFLIQILITHLAGIIGPNAFYFYSGYGKLWVTAAECFVFMSGFLVGIVYFKKLNFIKMWKRAILLFLFGAGLTVFFTMWGTYVGVTNGRFMDALAGALKFKYFYGWADILSLYAPFMLAAPFVLLLFKKRLSWIALFISFALWFWTQSSDRCTFFCVSRFSVFSWQILFVLGMFFGVNRDFFRKVYYFIVNNKPLNILVLTIFFICLTASFIFLTEGEFLNYFFGKYVLGPGRILAFFLWLFAYYQGISVFFSFLSKYLGWLYIYLGQNSLTTYIVESFVVFGFYSLQHKFGFLSSSFITVLAIIFVWIVVKFVNFLNNNLLTLNKIKT